jgi:hypothetical protein
MLQRTALGALTLTMALAALAATLSSARAFDEA